MKIKLNKNIQTEFPCLMKTDLGQIVLVKYYIYDNGDCSYRATVLTNLDNSDTSVGESWERKDLKGYEFLPKGYKITIKN